MKYIFKILITIILLGFVFIHIDAKQFFNIIPSIKGQFLIYGIIIGLLKTYIGIKRLEYLLKKCFEKVFLMKVIEDSLIAGFYNLFLPTVIGGDIPKIFLLSKHLNSKKKIILAIITERFFGFFSLITLAFFALFFIDDQIENYNNLVLTISITFLVFIVFFLILIKYANKTKELVNEYHYNKYLNKLLNIIKDVTKSLKYFNYKDIIITFIYSLFYQVIGIYMIFLFGTAIGIKVSFLFYLTVVPLIWFIIMIPISISGLGLREGAFVYIFSLSGVNTEKALILSFLFFFQTVLTSIIGGGVNLYRDIKSTIHQP